MGDVNIDALKWQNPEKLAEPMVDIINYQIITRNFSQVIQGPTRFWKDRSPLLIDHCWTNNPEKVSNIRIIP